MTTLPANPRIGRVARLPLEALYTSPELSRNFSGYKALITAFENNRKETGVNAPLPRKPRGAIFSGLELFQSFVKGHPPKYPTPYPYDSADNNLIIHYRREIGALLQDATFVEFCVGDGEKTIQMLDQPDGSRPSRIIINDISAQATMTAAASLHRHGFSLRRMTANIFDRRYWKELQIALEKDNKRRVLVVSGATANDWKQVKQANLFRHMAGLFDDMLISFDHQTDPQALIKSYHDPRLYDMVTVGAAWSDIYTRQPDKRQIKDVAGLRCGMVVRTDEARRARPVSKIQFILEDQAGNMRLESDKIRKPPIAELQDRFKACGLEVVNQLFVNDTICAHPAVAMPETGRLLKGVYGYWHLKPRKHRVSVTLW